jgi:hypothetical protein
MACKHPPIPHSAGKNWIERVGGLPEMMDCVARALFHEGGKPKQKAYEMAVGIVKDWAEGRRGAKPATIAKAQAAVASWEAKRARAKATK